MSVSSNRPEHEWELPGYKAPDVTGPRLEMGEDQVLHLHAHQEELVVLHIGAHTKLSIQRADPTTEENRQ